MEPCPPLMPLTAATTLLFGEGDANRQSDPKVFGDRMNQVAPGVNAYDPIGSASNFNSKLSTLSLPSLTLTSTVISPTYIDRSMTGNAMVMVPLAGQFNNDLDGRQHHCGVGLGGMFFPQGSGQLKGGGGDRNLAVLQFEPLLLEKTASAMLGVAVKRSTDFLLQEPRTVPMTVAGQPIGAVLQHVGVLVDLYQRDTRVLTQLGLQDLLYRHIALLLRPDAFLPPTSRPRTTADSAALVEQLCAYMSAQLDAGLTLTDLELFSGLSARSLQIVFKKQLGCSPMQWLTVQKLHKIREKLTSADASASVTSLAVAYFPNLGDFARYYRRQFGELPSQTRARQRR